MVTHNNQVSVTYSDSELRNLIEEFITQQKGAFTLKGVCSYILYWAIEDGKTTDTRALIECNDLSKEDQVRIMKLLEAIAADGRIAAAKDSKYYVLIK